jgi:hypothetical protein
VLSPGVVVEGFKEVKLDFKAAAARNIQKRRKNSRFPALIDFMHKTRFYLKAPYEIQYTHKTFFEEYINLKKICYLRRYGVIPVQRLEVIYAPSRPD